MRRTSTGGIKGLGISGEDGQGGRSPLRRRCGREPMCRGSRASGKRNVRRILFEIPAKRALQAHSVRAWVFLPIELTGHNVRLGHFEYRVSGGEIQTWKIIQDRNDGA